MKNTSNNEAGLEVGTRVYYTGDVANHAGTGTITLVKRSEWGTQFVVKLDEIVDDRTPEYGIEERTFHVSPSSFSDSPGRRFWRLEDFRRDRAEQIASSTGETVEEVLAKMGEI